MFPCRTVISKDTEFLAAAYEIQNVQIFTTTHNTDLMSNDLLRPDCYFLLKDNSIKAISELTEKELRQAHNLQKMYKAGAFNG